MKKNNRNNDCVFSENAHILTHARFFYSQYFKCLVFSVCQNSRCDARYASDHEKPGYKSSQNCKFWTPTHQLHSSLSFCRATQKRVLAFIMSRLDYCNSLLCGCPQYLINRFQKVQNNAAHLILKVPKTDYITPHLQTVQWLPVNARIQYKFFSLCFSAVNSSGPQYLADLLKIYVPPHQLCSSADTCTLSSTHKKLWPTCIFTLCTYSLKPPF